MTELVLVRHGQASFGAEDYDRLSPLGHQQAAWLGHYFREHGLTFDRAFNGALRRHRETAAGIASVHPLPALVEDARFDELHYDALEAEYLRATGADAPSSRAEFLAHFPEMFEQWARGDIGSGAERYDAFTARVTMGLQEALRPGERTLIVTSGGVIGAAIAGILGLNARATADLLINIHNASVHRLVHEAGDLRLALFNGSPHLEGQARAHARTYI
ncbi:MAG: histidine phosphatase family protein [Pseudomonadota bacterium]